MRADTASEHTRNRQIDTQPVNTERVVTGHGDGIEVDLSSLTGGQENTAGDQRQPQRAVVSIDQQKLEALTGARAIFEGIRNEMDMGFAIFGNITEEAMETNEFDFTNEINDLRTEGRIKRQFGQTGTSSMTVSSPPAVREFEERVGDCWKNVANEENGEIESKLMLTMPKVRGVMEGLDHEIDALNLRLNPPARTVQGLR